jgi:hypothetical protein
LPENKGSLPLKHAMTPPGAMLLVFTWVAALAVPVVVPTGVGAATPVRTVSPPPARLIPDTDPLMLYGKEIIYDVYRKNRKVGEHKMTFARDAIGDLRVDALFHLQIDVLFFKGAYTFDYSAAEIWRDKQMVSMAAIANDNGKVSKTSAILDKGVFKITGPKQTVYASSWVFPTNHWNRGQVESRVVLNTLNGRLADVEIIHDGFEMVEVAGRMLEAERFTYTGDVHDTDCWYDRAGRWVKMRFKAKDDSIVEYICRQCGLGA